MTNRTPRGGTAGRPRKDPPLETGSRLLDRQESRKGTVLEHACQYAHPKAQPVYSYLVRWDDGQVQAFTEAALQGDRGFALLDEE